MTELLPEAFARWTVRQEPFLRDTTLFSRVVLVSANLSYPTLAGCSGSLFDQHTRSFAGRLVRTVLVLCPLISDGAHSARSNPGKGRCHHPSVSYRMRKPGKGGKPEKPQTDAKSSQRNYDHYQSSYVPLHGHRLPVTLEVS